MGICLSVVMLLMGAGIAKDVKQCGKIRILGFYLQDTSGSFSQCLGPGSGFAMEISKFMNSVVLNYPGSMFGIYSFTDRGYSLGSEYPPSEEKSDYIMITPLVDEAVAQKFVSKVVLGGAGGANTDAFDVMYHLTVNGFDSGLDRITPLNDTYDAKVFYVFTDGVPEYLEAVEDECNNGGGLPCTPWCNPKKATRCCVLDYATNTSHLNKTGVSYGKNWNKLASCPIDLETLGKKINDDDWYVAYIQASDFKVTPSNDSKMHPWMPQVARMGTESRMAFAYTTYMYKDLADTLADITANIVCSAVPSNKPGGSTTGGPTNAPTTGGSTAAPTATGSTAAPTTGPTTTGFTAAPTQGGQGGTTTTTTKKPFPIGLVCGCAAGALAAIAGGAIAANRLTGYPPVPEYEFEGEEGVGREETRRETQVAMGEADFA